MKLDHCYMVKCGVDGLAWRFSEPTHLCTCGVGACAYIEHGNISVVSE